MSATVKLSSKLPRDPETNGLGAFADDLHDPEAPVCVIAWLVPSKITEDLATGARVPTVEVRRIEPIGFPDEVPQPVPFEAVIAPKGDVDALRVGDAVGELQEAGVILAKPVSPDASVFVFEAPEDDGDDDE